MENQKAMTQATQVPMVVARAAPLTPMAGKPRWPPMRQ